MNKNIKILGIIGVAIILACGSAVKNNSKVNTQKKMNVLFIMADDLRPEINAFGASHIISPNIDALAKSGATFQRAYCNIPVCGASRASLLSGTRPNRHRYYSARDVLNLQNPGVKSLPRVFKENGYTTISNGKIFHDKSDEKDAWDEMWTAEGGPGQDYFNKDNKDILKTPGKRGYPFEAGETDDLGYKDGKMALKVIEDLKKLKKADKLFFLTVGFHKPHLPFNSPKKYWDLYDRSKINLPASYIQPEGIPDRAYHKFGELRTYHGVPQSGDVSEEMAKELIHGYYACVSYVDAQLGKIMKALDETGLAENTIVVLIGDHGWNLGDHKLWAKHCNFETVLNTPLVLRVPGKNKGQKINNIVEFIDIFPTLTSATNISNPTSLPGQSLLPLLDKKKPFKDFAICRWNEGWTIIKDQYFYTEWIDKDDKVTASMLFDHSNDPLELNNLANSPKYTQTIVNLTKILRENRGADFNVDRRIEGKKGNSEE